MIYLSKIKLYNIKTPNFESKTYKQTTACDLFL